MRIPKFTLTAALFRNPDTWAVLIISAIGVVYAALSLLRHTHFLTGGYDLGIFDQAIWHYAHFQAPASSIKQLPNLLADHFHPALVLFAPLYWVYPHPETLLVAQAALVAFSAWPIYLLAKPRLHYPIAAVSFSVIYLLYWGIRSAVLYDFHEIALAVPVLCWLFYYTETKQWRRVIPLTLLLFFVREDLSLVVAAYGLFLVVTGKNWKLGIPTFFAGLFVFWLLLQTYTQLGATPREALKFLKHQPLSAWTLFFDNAQKVQTLTYTFGALIFLPIISPTLLMAIPLIAERFYSTRLSHIVPSFQYTAYLAPILIYGAIQVIGWLVSVLKDQGIWGKRLTLLVVGGATLGLLVMTAQYLSILPSNPVNDPQYVASEDATPGYAALALIPSSASVATQDFIMPHLSDRADAEELYQSISDEGVPGPIRQTFSTDYVVLSERTALWPLQTPQDVTDLRGQLINQQYTEIYNLDGWYVLKR